MNARVVDIAALVIRDRPERGCEWCDRAGRRCGAHRIADVANRLREERAAAEHELLVPSPVVVDVLTDALTDLDRLLAEVLPDHERTAR